MGASYKKKYTNYDGANCFKFHAAGREKQELNSNWDLRVTRTNARLVFNALTDDQLVWGGLDAYTQGNGYLKADSNASVKKFVVDKGKTFALPTLKRDGYNVTAWYAVSPYITKKVNIMEKTVKLDDVMSSKPGEVTLRKDGVKYFTIKTAPYNDGYYSMPLLREEVYDVFVNGEDTGIDVSNTQREHILEFYTVTVNVTDEAPWTDAQIELRDPDGKIKG